MPTNVTPLIHLENPQSPQFKTFFLKEMLAKNSLYSQKYYYYR